MTRKKLELDKILKMLEEKCISSLAKKMCLELKENYNNEDVEELLSEVSSAKDMLRMSGYPSFYEFSDVESSLKRTELDGVLSPEELLDIALVLKTARDVGSYHDSLETAPKNLDKYFAQITGNKILEDAIYNSVSSEYELFDTASHELFEIRRRVRNLNSKIRDNLNKMVSKENKFLQENLVTIRNDRFVIPVKTEHKGAVSGLIHDVSASGNTLFIEPTEIVVANNELRLLIEDEKREISRILKMLSVDCKNSAYTIRLDTQILTILDFIFAKAKLSESLNCTVPALTKYGYTHLINAIHPLLDPKTAVPVTLEIGGDFDTLIITGPNTGGKTVSLKTLGLLTLMTSLGLHIPVSEQSEIYIGGKVYADIGDEQSIGESLSTFSSHMSNIIAILEKAEKNDLVLFDELGSGTDPLEGSALAISIIEYGRKLSLRLLATTHYTDIKLYALSTDGVQNASFEFNMETLSPTYNLIIGTPGKSNAFEISKRLGLDSSIITHAKSLLDDDHNHFEDVLTRIESDRISAENLRKSAKEMSEIAKNALSSAKEREDAMNKKYDDLVEKGRLQSLKMINEAKKASQDAFREIEDLKKCAKEDVKTANINKARAEINKNLSKVELEKLQSLRRKNAKIPSASSIKIGAQVRLLKTNNIVTVIELPDKNGKLLLKAGILKISATLNEIELFEDTNKKVQEKRKIPQNTNRQLRNSPLKREVDIRGMDVLEGLSEVEIFISNAILSNLEEGFIIHGKGTGVLKNAVRDHVRSHKQVRTYRAGVYGEGEDGVTVITFK